MTMQDENMLTAPQLPHAASAMAQRPGEVRHLSASSHATGGGLKKSVMSRVSRHVPQEAAAAISALRPTAKPLLASPVA